MSTEPTGQPVPRPFYVSDQERAKIIAQRMSGVPVKDIAKAFDISDVTVWRICRPVKQEAKMLATHWREEQTELAVKSVNHALKDRTDSYKSAGIGVQVLKGLGVYSPDTQANIVTMINNVPRGLEDEFSLEATPDVGSSPHLPDDDGT